MAEEEPALIENPGADDYAAATRHALATGNVALGLRQIAAALTFDPLHEPYLVLLEQTLARAPKPVEKFQALRDAFFGVVAVRARVVAAAGRVPEALEMLSEVVRFRPDIPYLEWARAWIGGGFDLRRISSDMVAASIGPILDAMDKLPDEGDGIRVNLEAALYLLTRTRASDQAPSWRSAVISSAVLRRLGRVDEALRVIREEMARAPSWEAASELGVVHRCRGEMDLAISAWRRAVALEPEETSTQLDLADALLDDGQLGEAAAEYTKILARAPGHPWAHPSTLYARYLTSGEEEGRTALLSLARAEAPPGRARELAADLSLFETILPDPMDRVSSVVRSALAQTARSPGNGCIRVRVRTSAPEPPSVHLGFALGMRLLGREGELIVHTESAEPSGQPARATEPLWRLDGGRLLPALGAPPGPVEHAIRSLADARFDLRAWFVRAPELLARLSANERDAIAAGMVHPPRPSGPEPDPLGWVYRAQIAAAVLIACLDDDWPGSTRKRELFSIANGPDDWTVAAAIIVLGWVGREEARARQDILALFDDMLHFREGDESTGHIHPLVVCRLKLGGLDDGRRRVLWRWKRRFETTE